MVKFIKKIIKYIINSVRLIFLRRKDVFLDPSGSYSRSKFSRHSKIYAHTEFNDSFIGYYSYINSECVLNNVEIGNFTSIASKTEVICGTHPIDRISTHPIFYSTRKQVGITFVSNQIVNEFRYVKGTLKSSIIGNDVWIGYNVKILEGVKIGDGAIVLAGAIVTKDVEPYSIVGGVPARHLKYRFNIEERELLKSFQWWNKDDNWIKNNTNIFLDTDQFFNYIKLKI